MTDIIQLKTARYDGVEFPFVESATTGGNRLIKYNYPGSDKQSIERQGKAPRSFNMTIWIPAENYHQDRDNLVRVLERGRNAVLTHPTWGDVENIIPGIYTLNERISELGRASISVVFEVDDAPGIPQDSGRLAAAVQEQSTLLNTQLTEDVADDYKVTLSNSGSFSDSISNIESIADAFDVAKQAVAVPSDKLAEITKSINRFKSDAGRLARAPSDLSADIESLFQQIDNLYDAPGDVLRSLKTMFDFGSSDPVIMATTVSRIERSENRDTLRANVRTQALSYAYLNASQISYETTDDLDLVQSELESQYLDSRDNQALTNEGQEQLDRLRVQALKALDRTLINTRAIIEIETTKQPLSVLVYAHYGSTDLVDTIAELNNIKENAFVEGAVRILTA
jgi:prophage DNA circulation protein